MKKLLLILSVSYLCHAADSSSVACYTADSSNVTIGNLRDQPQFIAAAAQLWHKSTTPPVMTFEEATEKLQSGQDSEILPVCFIAVKQSKVVGMVRATSGDSDEWPWMCSFGTVQPNAVICGLSVEGAHRGEGIATKLCNTTAQFLKNLGIKTVYFKVKEDLAATYTKKGCEKVSESDEKKNIIMAWLTK